MNEKTKELSYAIVKGGVGSIPVVGGVLSELFSVAFSDPASKRKEEVILAMDERLIKLEEEGYDIHKLADSDEFLTISMQAYNIAMRTHQHEKRLALMNAISNTPRLQIDENIKLMFLTYIDDFNVWHLKILLFMNDPLTFFNETNKPNISMGAKSSILISAYPELSNQRVFYDRIVTDLYSRGLIAHNSLHGTMSGQGLWQSGTTDFGKQFIGFISE